MIHEPHPRSGPGHEGGRRRELHAATVGPVVGVSLFRQVRRQLRVLQVQRAAMNRGLPAA